MGHMANLHLIFFFKKKTKTLKLVFSKLVSSINSHWSLSGTVISDFTVNPKEEIEQGLPRVKSETWHLRVYSASSQHTGRGAAPVSQKFS